MAVGKGFAIGSATLTALALFVAFKQSVQSMSMDITNPYVVVGLFLGSAVVLFCASSTMTSVGRTAEKMVNEIRRQFKEISGLMEGSARPLIPLSFREINTNNYPNKFLLQDLEILEARKH